MSSLESIEWTGLDWTGLSMASRAPVFVRPSMVKDGRRHVGEARQLIRPMQRCLRSHGICTRRWQGSGTSGFADRSHIPCAVFALPSCPEAVDTKRHNVVLWLPRCLGGGPTVGDGEGKGKGKGEGELWLV